MNETLTYQVLQAAIDSGVREFIICAGSRNSSFVEALRVEGRLKTYYWPEERSAAFFALGLSRRTQRPVAIITTSGTAAGELLPAAMEAYYTGVPLILITADRPSRFSGSGAPQSAEQEKLFGVYTPFFQDIDKPGACQLDEWDRRSPAHLNVRLEEPQAQPKFVGRRLTVSSHILDPAPYAVKACTGLMNDFLSKVERPLVVVSTLKASCHEGTVAFLLALGAPILLEGISGLREEPRLQHLRILRTEKILETAAQAGYAIDGVLRIGGVPTHRIWRDLEYRQDDIRVCAVSDVPFSGLSWNRQVACAPVGLFLGAYQLKRTFHRHAAEAWLAGGRIFEQQLIELFNEEPLAEPSLIHALSKEIAAGSHVYLGNSLPIRTWDLAATSGSSRLMMHANRGLNGIDGQISTFLGLCEPQRQNWAIVGDLTMLYDMAGFWVLPQLAQLKATIVVVNNGGGKIFTRMYPYQEMLNAHRLNFEPLAKMWGLPYSRWEKVQPLPQTATCRLIELVPDEAATSRFWDKVANLSHTQRSVAAV